jgi:hypothetical protein
MTSKVGMLDLNQVKQNANIKIDELLRHTWLDPETARDFERQRARFQSKPFLLERLAQRIQTEISDRKLKYGR